MISLLSLESLRCGWPEMSRERRALSMKQLANIHVYALAQ